MFGEETPEKEYLNGQLLLDGGKLMGSYFHRAVVLICQHDAEGAFGLVLNRPSDNQVGDLLAADLPESIKEQQMFAGGPVQPAALSYLHSDDYLADGNVIENLKVGHSLEELVDIGASFAPSQKIRVFAGYSGWSPGQLEDEMKRGAWLTHPASVELVFQENSTQLWRIVMRQMGWQQRLFADAPDDLSWN